MKLTKSELKCLDFLICGEYGIAYYFRAFVERTGLNLTQVKRAVRGLARKGLAEYRRGLFDDDGLTAGSGYGITRKGIDFEEIA